MKRTIKFGIFGLGRGSTFYNVVLANNGEIVLLWHNTNPTNNPYHRSLYNKLIQLLKNLL